MDVQQVKQRFGVIGNSPLLNRAIDIAVQVAPTDLSVLITGESGTGKEVFPQIIHQFSVRKHSAYIAVNCGAIPEGTIDSELFGHEKGSFTGAVSDRKGYFEEANGGTIFLDEIGELPLLTQVRLLRVLESGEFIRVGSSKVSKTNVRVVAATNVNLEKAITEGEFREDLFYRLNSVPIKIPPLRDRNEDVILLFKKFASDCANKYKMPSIVLDEGSKDLLLKYRWPGNIRQLKNIAEQISVLEPQRDITPEILNKYLPFHIGDNLPVVIDKKGGGAQSDTSFTAERDMLYKVLFDMKKELSDLKKVVHDLIDTGRANISVNDVAIVDKLYGDFASSDMPSTSGSNFTISGSSAVSPHSVSGGHIQDAEEFIEESLSLEDKELEMIKKALDKYNGKRKFAAIELGISERTLYRKIKEHNLE